MIGKLQALQEREKPVRDGKLAVSNYLYFLHSQRTLTSYWMQWLKTASSQVLYCK
jgi:hypothetical protein